MKKTIFITLALLHSGLAFSQSIPITGDQYHLYGPNTAWGEYLKVGGNGRGTTNASIVSTNGNLHLDSKNGNALYLNHYSLGNTYINPQGGYVGIGTSSPGALLDIHSDKSTDHWISRMNTNGSNWSGFWETSDNVRLLLRDDTGNIDVNLRPNGSSYINGGNLGIGTVSPSQKLDVNGNIQSKGLVLVDPTLGGNSDYTSLYREDVGNDNAVVKLMIGDDELGSFNIGYKYWSNGEWVSTFFVNNYGKVGIGTTTPDAKLAVNGNIHTKEVKVDLIGWSDFVFENSYRLPTLKEVEQHIKEKGHLQDIPSAEEVKKDGIYLGEMDSKLLQKIEELMLYTIEQEKRIETLEDKNEKLILLVEKLLKAKIEE